MATGLNKNIKSDYFGVSGMTSSGTKNNEIRWVVNMAGVSRDSFKTEREAAIAVDKILISKGKEPRKILKRK